MPSLQSVDGAAAWSRAAGAGGRLMQELASGGLRPELQRQLQQIARELPHSAEFENVRRLQMT